MSEGTTIGQSVVISGELRAEEDLTIEGRVEGKVELDQNVVTVGPDGRVTAEVIAKAVVVQGTVNGDIMATDHPPEQCDGAWRSDGSRSGHRRWGPVPRRDRHAALPGAAGRAEQTGLV